MRNEQYRTAPVRKMFERLARVLLGLSHEEPKANGKTCRKSNSQNGRIIPTISIRSCLCRTRGSDFWYSFQAVMNRLVRITGNMTKKMDIFCKVNSKGYLSVLCKQSKWTMAMIRKHITNTALIALYILLRMENLNLWVTMFSRSNAKDWYCTMVNAHDILTLKTRNLDSILPQKDW